MSHMEIKFIFEDKTIESKELSNAHGGAPFVWNIVAKKYLGLAPGAYLFESEKIWPLYKKNEMPLHHKAVLLMTYDGAVITKPYFKKAAQDIRAFLADFKQESQSESRINHWNEIAQELEKDPGCAAVGFYWTSVGEDPFQGSYDEESEDYLPFSNWGALWSVYATVEKYT